ncbi:MAG: hypothetical protein KDN05_20210 [Verrucomicrobiae bacterium]|nr:hypothetical protein [Verrucomicrobiae bacterium]
MKSRSDSRFREIAPGAAVLLVVTAIVCGTIYGWRLLPGLLGEWIGFMVGLMTTPFLLEFSFLCLGLFLVLAINHWRRSRDGDDFVVLEQVTDGDANLPDHARWAVYRKDPLPGETPGLLAQAEGAFAVGDTPAALGFLAEMTTEELHRPETLRLRIELARSAGNEVLATKLERELASDSPEQGA